MRYQSQVISLRGETARALGWDDRYGGWEQWVLSQSLVHAYTHTKTHMHTKKQKTTTSTGRYTIASLIHGFSQILRNPQPC